MFKQTYFPKLIIFALVAAIMLWPVMLAAMPVEPLQSDNSLTELAQSGNLFPMYNSYNLKSGEGPSDCPFPQRFRFGTRTVYSYAPITAKVDVAAAIVWYELDEEGQLASDEPLAVATGELAADTTPYSDLSFNRNQSGNVAPVLFINDGSEWLPVALGAFRIVGEDESAPEPGTCPLE